MDQEAYGEAFNQRDEEFRTLSDFGRALWFDETQSRRVTVETVSAVSLLNVPDEDWMIRASLALVDRAARDGGVSAGIQLPFYRLTAKERFLLSALHIQRWSYERVAQVLSIPASELPGLAWRVRVHLVSQWAMSLDARSNSKLSALQGASGNPPVTSNCPEFDVLNPWTQRFLDDEMPRRETLFLQSHLMACESCRNALNRCRDLYYQVEAMLPRSDERFQKEVSRAYLTCRAHVRPLERTVLQTLAIFLHRTEAQWLLAILLMWLVLQVLKFF